MNVSRFLVSTAAAVTVVGAIGFATAQEGDNKVTPAQSGSSSMNSGSTGSMNNTGRSNTGSTGAVGAASGNTGNMGNERVAQADRN